MIEGSAGTSERQYLCKTLIVGAGLAGASLGFLLRKAGDDVLLLELLDAKEKNKLCGGPDPQHYRSGHRLRSLVGQVFGAVISRRRSIRGGDAHLRGRCGPTCTGREKNTVSHKVFDHEAWK